MNLDSDKILPSPSNWFSTNIEYEGHGQAEFANPEGTIQGPVRIRFEDSGESKIEMEIAEFIPKESPRFGLHEFFSGQKPVKRGDTFVLGIGSFFGNPCINFVVTTPQGIFSATENITLQSWVQTHITFHLLRSQFDVAEARQAKYWVLPLSNFISEFRQSAPDLDRHPLRIYPTPTIPDDLTGEDAFNANQIVNRNNLLIIFEFNANLGFIEPLADFEERKRKLLAGRERNTLTAVMVGETGSNSIDYDNLERWFPFDFLYLLGLATGNEVGSPWIEFRDAQGALVRRIHYNLEHPTFSTGHAAISEVIHGGTGYLLTKSLSSPEWSKSYLRVALKHIVRGGLDNISIETKLAYLFRALDSLRTEYQLNKPLTPNETLSEENRNALNKAFKTAAKIIHTIAEQADGKGQSPEAKVLRKIANQIARAKNIEIGFGKAVIALLDKFCLADEKIITAHYQVFPRVDEKSWHEVLSAYRGITMHRGFFDFRSGMHDIEDAIRIMNHLHDILVRIIFKILGYDGAYQPTVITAITDLSVDWVTPDLPASRLGYK